MNRRNFIRTLSLFSAGACALPFLRLSAQEQIDFFFTRLSYESGDWEVDERMPANVLNSLIEYTSLRVDIKELKAALAEMTSMNLTLLLENERLHARGPGSNNVVH